MRRAFARVSAASAALTRWEQRHPFISGIVMTPAITAVVWGLAFGLYAVFGV